jgi:N6-L-threonylcarbamoyladenine synthase
MKKILAIETSCDETAAAVLENGKICSNIVASQIEIHKKTGGIVPEIASREHTEKILSVVEEALKKARTDIKNIDLIAITCGPGLIGSLLVGVETAKTLAYLLNKPIIGINHLEGHIFANWIDFKPKLPAIILIVSGGHTSLVLMKNLDNLKIIGETRDDAAGEAFDKVAKLLDLGYPGGPAIEKVAGSLSRPIKPYRSLSFPRPMLKENDFSFSGLKTAVLYKTLKLKLNDKLKSQIAFEFQKAIVETLVEKTINAAQKYEVKSILLSGGVTANKLLRIESEKRAKGEGFDFHVPAFEYCTDNAAMIGMAAHFQSLKRKPSKWYDINADANIAIKEKNG